jgi:apolipoprotein N-acyltransferase
VKFGCAGLATPVVGGLLLAAATPPAWFPGAEFLVLPGLALWFVVATDRRRSLWHSYVLGCAHMAWFSWSVHCYLWFSYGAVVVLGGLYYVLPALALRAARRAVPLVFALVVAASFWLRAVMPQIYYPHGQPCHALWQWPVLLRGVVVGGEPLLNVMLAAIAAAGGELWRSWRVAVPAWSVATRNVAVAVLAFGAVAVVGHTLAPRAPEDAPTIAVAVIEPSVNIVHEMAGKTRARQGARFLELFRERLIAPTRALLAGNDAPDVVLWPESSVPDVLRRQDLRVVLRKFVGIDDAIAAIGRWPRLDTCLVIGLQVADDDEPETPAAVCFELATGRPVAHQEKRVLVPGGEFPPLYAWLPSFVGDTLRGWFEAALGPLPEATPGTERPPLRGPHGVPFGALICYDNAYPGPAAAQVEQGARWLCVLSNESWFEGGGELTQLMAMTVLRALETGTPFVRCTQDGWSGVVGADGRLAEQLPLAPAPQPAARILRALLRPGAGRLPPLAWLRRATGPACGLGLLALLLHAVVRWARLRAARTASRAASASG